MENSWQTTFRRLIDDIIDLALLRIKPLEYYQYPRWWLAMMVTIMGVVEGTLDDEFVGDFFVRFVFYVTMSWAELLLMNAFMRWWLQRGDRWSGKGSLWPLLIVANGINLISPLLIWAEAPFDDIFSIGLALWSLLILIEALSRALPAERKHVIWGIALFVPMSVMLYVLMQIVGMSLGWLPAQVDVPAA